MATLKSKPTSKDYELLGVTPHVSEEALKKAYRYRVKMWHPDRFQQKGIWEKDNAEERFKEVNTAYQRILFELQRQKKEQNENRETPQQEARQAPHKKGKKSHQKQAHGSAGPRAALRSWRKWLPFSPTAWKRFGVLERLKKAVRERRNPLILCVFLFLLIYVNHDLFSTGLLPRGGLQKSALERVEPLLGEGEEDETGVGPTPEMEEDVLDAPGTGLLDTEKVERDTAKREYFSLGSTEGEVLRVQGPPSYIKGRIWIYGLSEVVFRDGKVARYNNFDGRLKVRLSPHLENAATEELFFTLGSTKEEVLMIQGTPTRVMGNHWSYGFSEIRFKEDRVDSFDNFFGNLRVRLYPSEPLREQERPIAFSINSTRDEVLAVQGTPTSVRGTVWYYGLSSIQFRDGRVQAVFDHTGDLHFVPSLDR